MVRFDRLPVQITCVRTVAVGGRGPSFVGALCTVQIIVGYFSFAQPVLVSVATSSDKSLTEGAIIGSIILSLHLSTLSFALAKIVTE